MKKTKKDVSLTRMQEKAHRAFDSEQYGRCAKAYDELMKHQRTLIDVADFRKYTVSLIEMERFEDALKVMRMWARHESTSAILYSMRGYVLRMQHDMKGAERAYRRSLRLRPRASGFCILGDLLARCGRTRAAIRCFESAIRSDPQYGEAYYNLGVMLQTKCPQQAQNCFHKAKLLNISRRARSKGLSLGGHI
jgi:tetratricopeptide (TPR) repeat protein